MAKKVSIINMKGGVGKTTLTIQLAWHFAGLSNWLKNVLVVDLDPQFNTSQYLLGQEEYESILKTGKPTVWEIFEQNLRTPSGINILTDPHQPVCNVQNFVGGSRIDLIPSRLDLAYSLKQPGQKERQLARTISKIEDEYDLILIDCAPTESILTTAAYLCSNYLLVPVKPEYLSTIGLPLLLNSMTDFKREYEGHQLELAGVVFNGADEYFPEEAKSKRMVREVADTYGWYVFKAEVPFSRSFPKGAREGKPIDRTSNARSWKVEQVREVAEEFAKRIEL